MKDKVFTEYDVKTHYVPRYVYLDALEQSKACSRKIESQAAEILELKRINEILKAKCGRAKI